MNTLFNQIKEKIKEKIGCDDIVLIDNSNLHLKHKSFDPKKFHLKLIIRSNKLKKMNSTIFKLKEQVKVLKQRPLCSALQLHSEYKEYVQEEL